jgi:hypothetical protein
MVVAAGGIEEISLTGAGTATTAVAGFFTGFTVFEEIYMK